MTLPSTLRRLTAATSLLALPALALAQPPASPAAPLPTGTRLDVVAQGEATRAPDIAEVSAGVVTQAPTASATLAANAEQMAATRAALRRAGIAERDVQTTAVSLQPQYRYGENVPPAITGYQATSTVNIRFRDVARAGSVLDALVAAGANQVGGPTLTIDHPEAALDEARTQAIGIARARAELYAKAAGLRVVRIVAIDEGGADRPAPAMPMMAMMRGKSSSTEIAPGEQRLGVTVNVTFELR